MDLGAYINIGNLDAIAKENGICVPRLRGYRLMKDEKPVNIKEPVMFGYFAHNLIEEWFIKEAVRKYIPWQLHEYSRSKNKKYYNRMVRLYTNTGNNTEKYYDYWNRDKNKPFPWHRFHGKLRNRLKLLYKQRLKKTHEQYDVFNKYCGRDDVLYIHARVGGDNWEYFGCKELEKKDWFLEKVDDSFDRTYCDIYAKINIDNNNGV